MSEGPRRALAEELVALLDEPTCVLEPVGQPAVAVPPDRWRHAASVAVERLDCDFFDWLTAVDEQPGVELAVHLRSVARGAGLLIRTVVGDEPAVIESLVPVSAGAAWHEREVHEMFGVTFTDHPDPAPLLVHGVGGHPLRKKFALPARVRTPWPGAVDPATAGRPGGRSRRRARPPGVPAEWTEEP